MLNNLILSLLNQKNNYAYYLLKIFQKFYKKSRLNDIKKIVSELKTKGYTKINDYFLEPEISFYKEEVTRILKIRDFKADDEFKPGNLKLKHIQNYSSALTKLTQHFHFLLISFFFYGKMRFPNVLYTYTQDGTFEDGIIDGKCEEQISGKPHFDSHKDYLKILILLEDIDQLNGPTHLIQNSSTNKYLKKKFINFMNGKNDEAVLNEDIFLKIKKLKTVKLTGKKGDIILINTKNIHWAGNFISGKREILWLYF